MKKLLTLLLLSSALLTLPGCFLTKVVSVPMRVLGAAISVIPVTGNTMDEALDSAADTVDELPF